MASQIQCNQCCPFGKLRSGKIANLLALRTKQNLKIEICGMKTYYLSDSYVYGLHKKYSCLCCYCMTPELSSGLSKKFSCSKMHNMAIVQ